MYLQPFTIYNMSTIALAHNPILHAQIKHMELDLFHVREKVLAKQLSAYSWMSAVCLIF